jgi:hypothetical protein
MIDKDHPLVPKNPDGVARIIVLGRLSEPNETEAETLATIESSLAAAVGSQPNSAAPTHRLLANSGARLWGKSPNVTFVQDTNGNSIWQMQTFWGHTAEMMRTLERLSRKELAGEPFTVEESGMLRKTIASKESGDRDYDHSRDYSGWYCQLLYPRPDGIDKWHPTVADVHTDPNGAEILEYQQLVRQVIVADHVFQYAADLVRATRPKDKGVPKFVPELIAWGAGPRASQYLILGGKARAILKGRLHVTTDDIREIAHPVLRHRLVTTFNADAEGVTTDQVISRLLDAVPPPQKAAVQSMRRV